MSHSDAEDWVRRILNDVCVELGFCLSPTECARLEAAPPRSVDSFTDAIFLSEGIDPRLADGELWRLVRAHVALHFRIPVEKPIVADIGALLNELAKLGVNIAGSHYDEQHFGNYYVDFAGSGTTFRICRDRGQYVLDAAIDQLKSLKLFRALNSRDELREAVLKYVGSTSVP